MFKTKLRAAAALAAAASTIAAGAALLAAAPANAATTATTSTTSSTQAAAVSDTLLPGQKLLPGQYIRSKSGVYGLAMTKYGTLGVSQRGVSTLLWTARFRSGVVAVMGTGGTLNIIYGRTQIASIGAKSAGAKLVLPNTGNLEIVNTRGKAIWNRHMIIDVLTPGFEILPVDAVGGGVTMYSPNHLYTLVMRTDGDLVLLQNGKTILWRTGTAGHPGSSAWILSDGAFETLNSDGDSVWRWESRRPGTVVQLRDDGRLQLVNGRTVVKILH
jgi:hypothetical protein